MQLRYVFTELGQGLRRNLSMHLAVILTLFVSLTLVGLGVLLNQQATKAADQWGNELEITVFLCRNGDDNPACPTEVTDAQKQAIIDKVKNNDEVAGYHVESKEQAFEKVKELYGPEKFEGPHPAATADDMAESVWITLKDPNKYQGIVSEVQGLDGVSGPVRDQRETIGPILRSIQTMKYGALGIAALLVLAALLLVRNTIRLAAFARRKEIGIMRLVGASTLYIALPFLLEALVTALIGVGLTVGALGGFMYFGVEPRLRDFVGFLPWVGFSDFTLAAIVVAILGPVLTLLPTLVLTRKYIKV
jgi:cell division transport system permease protein